MAQKEMSIELKFNKYGSGKPTGSLPYGIACRIFDRFYSRDESGFLSVHATPAEVIQLSDAGLLAGCTTVPYDSPDEVEFIPYGSMRSEYSRWQLLFDINPRAGFDPTKPFEGANLPRAILIGKANLPPWPPVMGTPRNDWKADTWRAWEMSRGDITALTLMPHLLGIPFNRRIWPGWSNWRPVSGIQ